MTGSIRFAGACPTCGRSLHVPVELHGKLVQCHGCGAEFRATSGSERPLGPGLQTMACRDHIAFGRDACGRETYRVEAYRGDLDNRVDSLLEAADRQLEQACLQSAPPAISSS